MRDQRDAILTRARLSYAFAVERGVIAEHERQLAAWRASPIRAVDPPAAPLYVMETGS